MSAARDKVIGSIIRNIAEMLRMATEILPINLADAVRVAPVVLEGPVELAVRVALAVPEGPVGLAVQVALAVPEDPAGLAVQVELVVPEDPAAREALGVSENPAVPVALVVPAEAVLVQGRLRAQLALPQRTKSVIAAHHPDLVPLPAVAEDLAAAVAETTLEPAAAEAAKAWAAAE